MPERHNFLTLIAICLLLSCGSVAAADDEVNQAYGTALEELCKTLPVVTELPVLTPIYVQESTAWISYFAGLRWPKEVPADRPKAVVEGLKLDELYRQDFQAESIASVFAGRSYACNLSFLRRSESSDLSANVLQIQVSGIVSNPYAEEGRYSSQGLFARFGYGRAFGIFQGMWFWVEIPTEEERSKGLTPRAHKLGLTEW